MTTNEITISFLGAAVIVLVALPIISPIVFAGRVSPLVWLDGRYLGGIATDQLHGVIKEYAQQRHQEILTLTLRGKTVQLAAGEVGLSVSTFDTERRITNLLARRKFFTVYQVLPVWQVDRWQLKNQVLASFSEVLTLPVNTSLELTSSGQVALVKSKPGEGINITSLEKNALQRLLSNVHFPPIELQVVPVKAAIQDNEVEGARKAATRLLHQGFEYIFGEKTFLMRPSTVLRLLHFVEQDDPLTPGNAVLGVQFDQPGLVQYLEKTVAPEVSRQPQNARFEVVTAGDKVHVQQFEAARAGEQLDIAATTQQVARQLSDGRRQASLVMVAIEPDIHDLADVVPLPIAALLARGESDFRGSPPNRLHNIRVGAARYHGLLVPPEVEFSFNKFLGPVSATAGFKPELVIKKNVTTPEYGGGLCQVSTTLFRAAVLAGLKVTQRRNHAYAVRYYGKPGFDATIYPPYTDLRFLNNTPGYILIQTRIEGTKLSFEFWGTSDQREVEVKGPTLYQRQPDGAVKAVLRQKVHRNSQVVIEDTFYSNYQSPQLFPKVVAANGEPLPL